MIECLCGKKFETELQWKQHYLDEAPIIRKDETTDSAVKKLMKHRKLHSMKKDS